MEASDTAAPRNPYGHSPPRIAGSIRRTSTIDTDWPQGRDAPMRMRGHARDLYTPADGGTPQILAEHRYEALVSPRREILAIESDPPVAGIAQLVGVRGGGHLRSALAELLPDEHRRCSPLNLILDDLAGASLVAGWIWWRWKGPRPEAERRPSTAGRNGQMENVCAGFITGSSALQEDGSANPTTQSSAAVLPLENPLDPQGWHTLAEQRGIAMRRARRLDLWSSGGAVHLDIGFQDSGPAPEGGRVAVHEYHVSATADVASLILASVVSDPRVLPYRECPAASRNVDRMLGQPLASFRSAVPATLPGTLGCTHLNDVLRSLADVPRLLQDLRAAALAVE